MKIKSKQEEPFVVLIKLPNTTSHIKRPYINLAYLNTPEISFFSVENTQLSHIELDYC